MGVIFGSVDGVNQDEYNDSVKLIKEFVKSINQRTKKDQEPSLADYWLAASLSTLF